MLNDVTRYPGGVSNVDVDAWSAGMGQLDPTKFHTFFDDFDTFTAADWTITRVGTTPTEALTDADGGRLLLTMAATDDSSSFLQKVGESFKFASGKELWFRARFQVSDATQSDFVFGLQITDTTPLAVSDGVYFRKDDGDANIDFVVVKDSTATTATAVSTVTSATDLTLEFYYDGGDNVYYGKDGTFLGSVATTNLPNDEELTISFGVQNGEAVAKTMSVDYIFACKER